MKQTSKALFLTLAALVCLPLAGPVARADDASGGVVNDGLIFSGGFSNAAGSDSGIIATNGNTTIDASLFVSDLNLGGSIYASGSDGSAGFLMVQSVNFFALETNGFFNLTGSLGGSGIINTGTLITDGGTLATPEPATWLLAGLGLLLILRTHKARRRPV